MKPRTMMRPGYLVRFVPDTPPENAHWHVFGGPNRVDGAWCPNCRLPLLKLLSIDALDPRLGPFPMSVLKLSLFACRPCLATGTDYVYEVTGVGAIAVLRHAAENQVTAPRYLDCPTMLPESPVVLTRLTRRERSAIQRLNLGTAVRLRPDEEYLRRAQHQIGGEPYLIEHRPPPICVKCGRTMAILASVADRCPDPRGAVGDRSGQILYYYCQTCLVITARQSRGAEARPVRRRPADQET